MSDQRTATRTDLPAELNPRRRARQRPPSRRPRMRVLGVAAALLGVAVLAGSLFGVALAKLAPRHSAGATASHPQGRSGAARPTRPGSATAPPSAPAAPSAGPSTVPGTPLALANVTVLDPVGDEGRASAAAAHDGNPATSWSTQHYTTADFGRLKPGVGLLVDLGAPQPVGKVTATMAVPGATVDLRAGNNVPHSAADLPVVAAAQQAGGTATYAPNPGTTARYWLVWVSQLPASPEGYRTGISELAFSS